MILVNKNYKTYGCAVARTDRSRLGAVKRDGGTVVVGGT